MSRRSKSTEEEKHGPQRVHWRSLVVLSLLWEWKGRFSEFSREETSPGERHSWNRWAYSNPRL